MKDFLQEALELNEMAFPKKVGENSILNLCPTTMNHLAYVFMLPEHNAHKHWLQEVATNLEKIDNTDLKTKSGKVSVDFIRNNLTWHIDTVKDAEIFVYSAFKNHIPELPLDNFSHSDYEKFQVFMNYLYEELAPLLVDKVYHTKEFYQEFLQDKIASLWGN